MYNSSYKYGPPPIIHTMKSRVINSGDIIATTIPASLISAVLNEGIESGDVNFDNVEINLENATGASTTVENLNVNTITTAGSYIRFLKDIRMEGKMLFSSSDLIDEDYVVDIKGSLNVTGIKTNIETDQLIIKDNCISIGAGNDSDDNFVNGLYFPKKDDYLGAGSTVDKIGMLSIPYGIFSANKFDVKQVDSKRFESNKSSVRFSYIISDYDFDTAKTTENQITLEEQTYVNSLNNIANESSSFYVNIESHNITLHGGNIISGVNKDLNFYLTKQNGSEDNYFTLNLNDIRIDIKKSINFTIDDANILASTNIHFKSNTSNPIEYFQIGSTANSTFKSLNFLNNGNGDANLIFGGQNTFKIQHNQSGTIKSNILIDSTDSVTDRIEMDSRLVVLGPKSQSYPSIIIKNELAKTGTISPQSRIYYQQKLIPAFSVSTSYVDFDLLDTYEINVPDIIFTGYIMISGTNTNKHLHVKIEGSYHFYDSASTPETNMIVISKKDIELAKSSDGNPGEIVITSIPNISGGSFQLKIGNNLSNSFNVMVKLEIIST
jgi:hypothetical protein|uniref:Uncharacterized protein n=1 Tax=viral metagenome TaxID=1070528 RepID=A0A6C0IT27_9ZZZZ